MSQFIIHSTRGSLGVTVALGLAALLTGLIPASLAQEDIPERILRLSQAGPVTGPFARTTQSGEVEIEVLGGRTRLEFILFGLTPNAVHSVWLEWDTARPPFSGTGENLLATDPETGTTANVYAYTPAAPDNAAFTGGMGSSERLRCRRLRKRVQAGVELRHFSATGRPGWRCAQVRRRWLEW